MADGDGGNSGNNGGGSNAGGDGKRGFTQDEVDRIVADRLTRERGKFADYNDLKARAESADKQKSDVDKLTDAVRQLTDRAEKAERETIRRDVADQLKLPKFFTDKLTGTTKEDLEREGKELVETLKQMGVKLGADGGDAGGKGNGSGSSSSGSDGGQNGGGQGLAGGDGGNAGNDNSGSGQQNSDNAGAGKSLLSGRPTENLRPGTATSGGGQQVDAAKIASSILDRSF